MCIVERALVERGSQLRDDRTVRRRCITPARKLA
jgi:hypothetical protein